MHATERKAMLLTFWKDLRSVEKVVVLALWSCADLYPRAPQGSCTHFLSLCLVCWAGSERFASARFQLRSCRQRELDVYFLYLRELCLAGETWKFTSDLEILRCIAGSYTPCGFGALYAFFLVTSLWDDFWQTFQCATVFWICFSWSARKILSDKVRL